MLIKHGCTLFLFLSILVSLRANNTNGLMFRSKEVSRENRTGLDITHSTPFRFKHSLALQFDISFREGINRFGYIFRLKDEAGHQSFDLVARLEGEKPSLYLVADKKEAIAQLPVDSTVLHQINRWHTISLEIDSKSDIIILKGFGYEKKTSCGAYKPSSVRLLFGTSDDTWWLADETPPMSIRNIRITTDNDDTYFWPLEKTDSKIVKDSESGKKALLINPEWVEDEHSSWKPLVEMTFENPPLVTWNEKEECLVMVKSGGLIQRYFPETGKTDSITPTDGRYVQEEIHQLIADGSTLKSYSLNYPAVSQYHSQTNSWSYKKELPGGLPRYWHHNKLINPITQQVTTIGGYGFYTYHNTIQSYNDSTHRWEQIIFAGDTIYPRYLSGFGMSQTSPSKGYLFGGLGNRSGKQVLGKEYFYDLYQIDFSDKTIKKLWYLSDTPAINYTPSNSIIIDDNNDCFYSLITLHEKQKTVLQTIRGSLSKPEIQILANEIPFDFVDVTSFASLYRWNSANKLLALTFEKGEKGYVMRLYSILNPPSAKSINHSVSKINPAVIVLLAAFSSLLVALLALKRKKQNTGITQEPVSTPEPHNGASIRILGEFEAHNSKGTDITHLFSPTVKELFLLMTMHKTLNSKGITSSAIGETLWADKSEASARNNRGVNIKKLRDIFDELGASSVKFDNNSWSIDLDPSVECDFIEATDILTNYKKDRHIDNESITRLLSYLHRGLPAPDIKAEWMDDFKDRFTAEVVLSLEDMLEERVKTNESPLIIDLCNTLHLFDRLNEKALTAKCVVLTNTGRNSLALETYESFCRQYSKSYGEDYKTTFKQLIKQKL